MDRAHVLVDTQTSASLFIAPNRTPVMQVDHLYPPEIKSELVTQLDKIKSAKANSQEELGCTMTPAHRALSFQRHLLYAPTFIRFSQLMDPALSATELLYNTLRRVMSWTTWKSWWYKVLNMTSSRQFMQLNKAFRRLLTLISKLVRTVNTQ